VPAHPYYLSAPEAAAALGVTVATVYAYTSRGLVRSEPVPGGPTKARRYLREDINRLRERKAMRRDPATAAARGLDWGGPLLESGITLIDNGRVYYRGRDAVTLAATATLEDVAALLWGADDAERDILHRESAVLSARRLSALRAVARDPVTMLQAALPIAGAADAAAYDLRPAAVRLTGARIIRLLATIVAPRRRDALVHQALQAQWAGTRAAIGDVIRTALVLCADHELNVSAFTARCAASAGASPYDVVAAAMATLKGYKHGGAAERVLALFAEADTVGATRVALAARLRRGEPPAGFGHPLYPHGDPRALALLRLAADSGNDRALQRVRRVAKAATALTRDLPNLDFGLAAVTLAYGLPPQAPVLLFALGRTTGWIAHAIEEYASGRLIRPRARYTGPPPDSRTPDAR
jgi:citrate synthase